MERLRSDSPAARRIVFAFLDFLQSVEPAAGVDLEGLDVVRECLEEVFELDKYPGEHIQQSQLLIDMFSHDKQSKELNSNFESESRHLKTSNGPPTSSFPNNHVPGTSGASEFLKRSEDSIAEDVPKDELFGQFYAALDKINFFTTTPGEDEDHVQLTKATNFFEDAVHELEKSGSQTISRKNLAETFKSQGNKAMQSKSYDEAIELYTCAIVLCENAIYYCNRAAAHTQVHKYNEAIEDCKKSVEIDPNYTKAYSRQGLVYYALRKYKEAILLFLRALQLDPNNESVRENIRVAQQKWREEQQHAAHYQNGSASWQQRSAESAGLRTPHPPGTHVPFNISDFPNIFTNMTPGAAPDHDGQDQSSRPSGPSSHNGAGPSMPIDISYILRNFNIGGLQVATGPETHTDSSMNFNFQQIPEDLTGIFSSVSDMFSTHPGQRDDDNNQR